MSIATPILIAVGVVLLTASVMLFRRAAVKRRVIDRVCVQGAVVRHVFLYRPPRLEFDYPAPDGSRLRAIGQIAFSLGGIQQQLEGLSPGAPILVYVDPHNPQDAILTPGLQAATAGCLPRF
ncbi:hypothetical protein G7066_05630 [Leucobacter coleopterorum]|uniref:DUF3592 domain-containing protein n=1 Tax=Leucobacter coleopterorum TaxID=2714933 RepID=A0ABX6JVC3_9MICO|nr:DUF3592 domain-containing protein [Leucobacter coleopterorum]QIM18261.1 hypothetical protein G7066_05630 [Leucobacter coleopterorum]